MIIIGHENISFNYFYSCDDAQSIKKTPSNSCILLDNSNFNIIHHCVNNDISYCSCIDDIYTLLVLSNLNCDYVLIEDKILLQKAQNIAKEYLLDTKILYKAKKYSQLYAMSIIEELAKQNIDGIVFSDAIK